MTNLARITHVRELFIPKGQKLIIQDAFLVPDFSTSPLTLQVQVFGNGGEEDDFSFNGSITTQTKLGTIQFGPYGDKAIVVIDKGFLMGSNFTFE